MPYAKQGGTGVIHCFTGSLDECQQFLDCGFFISFSGIVTFKNATHLQEVVRYMPLDRILIETDSPYLSPMPLRGKINEPAHLVHTCNFIADLCNIDKRELARITVKNSSDLFKLHD
jgi:TatD DNase family protein